MVDVKKCTITRYPAPVLAEEAEPIAEVNDNIRMLADKMLDIMVETQGIGLAGPQAGVPLQIFVISLDGTKEHGKAYINPKVEPYGPVEVHEEGCLSLPGIWSKIKRYANCKVTAIGLDGKEFFEDVSGLHARALQHENDHLQGHLIVDRMTQVAKIANRNRLKELRDIYEEGLSKQG